MKQWLYFDPRLNEMILQIPRLFPHDSACVAGTKANRVIVVGSQLSSEIGMSAIITDAMPNHDFVSSGQIFPRYIYDPHTLERRDGITDGALTHFQKHYQTASITKDAIFAYIYGILHSPAFKTRFHAALMKELPRAPLADSYADFRAFADIGNQLAGLHLGYERLWSQYPDYLQSRGITITLQDKAKAQAEPSSYYKVDKMKLKQRGSTKDRTTIIYNPHITISSIPEEAWDYKVSGKPALWWVMQHQLKIDRSSGIVKDPNLYDQDNYKYLFELLCGVLIASLKTQELIAQLPTLQLSTLSPAEHTAGRGDTTAEAVSRSQEE